MGFDKNAVIEALQMHKSLDNAIQYLLEASLHKEAVQVIVLNYVQLLTDTEALQPSVLFH